jgi:hypothetical protein
MGELWAFCGHGRSRDWEPLLASTPASLSSRKASVLGETRRVDLRYQPRASGNPSPEHGAYRRCRSTDHGTVGVLANFHGVVHAASIRLAA